MSNDQLADLIDTGGSIIRRTAFVTLFIAGAVMLARAKNCGTYSDVLRNNVVLTCFVGLACLSVFWSTDPQLTFRRVSEYLIVCVGAMAAGRVLGMRGVVWLGFLGSTGYLLIGLTSEIALGTFHPFNLDYRFCGTLHPNHEAWNCGLLLMSGSALFSEIRRRWRPIYLMAIALGTVCLFLTKSRTSLLCGVFAVAYVWAGRLRFDQKVLIVVSTGTVFAAALLAANLVPSRTGSRLDGVLLAGRDADSYDDLSGRLPLWGLAMGYIEKRPVAGYGFNSFWTPEHILDVSWKLNWSVPHAHNEFIELMLDLGVVGLVLYLYQLAGTWRLLRLSCKAGASPILRFYLALMFFYFACMFTEAIAFDVGLPTFCLLSLLWSRKLWLRNQFAPHRMTVAIPAIETVQAYT